MDGLIHSGGIIEHTAYLPDKVLGDIGLQTFGHLGLSMIPQLYFTSELIGLKPKSKLIVRASRAYLKVGSNFQVKYLTLL